MSLRRTWKYLILYKSKITERHEWHENTYKNTGQLTRKERQNENNFVNKGQKVLKGGEGKRKNRNQDMCKCKLPALNMIIIYK